MRSKPQDDVWATSSVTCDAKVSFSQQLRKQPSRRHLPVSTANAPKPAAAGATTDTDSTSVILGNETTSDHTRVETRQDEYCTSRPTSLLWRQLPAAPARRTGLQ